MLITIIALMDDNHNLFHEMKKYDHLSAEETNVTHAGIWNVKNINLDLLTKKAALKRC